MWVWTRLRRKPNYRPDTSCSAYEWGWVWCPALAQHT